MSSSSSSEILSSASDVPFQPAQLPSDRLLPREDDLESPDNESSSVSPVSNSIISKKANQHPPIVSKGEHPELYQTPEESNDSLNSDVDVSDNTPLPTRPNRYREPASTWRERAAPERDLAASLDQLRAKDLSVHLYNAFMLKKRVDTDPRHQKPEDMTRDTFDGSTDWKPPKVWTAWPLPPGEVPREGEGKRWEEHGTLEREPSLGQGRSSEQLQELVVAQVLQQARWRFQHRDHSNFEETQSQSGLSSREPARAPDFSCEKGRPKALKPAIMADNQLASKILRPTISHTMMKLDGLLTGLHHARSSYSTIDDSASESQDQVTEPSVSQEKSGKRMRVAPPLNQSAAVVSATSIDSDASDHSKSKKRVRSESRSRRSRTRGIRTRRRRLGLRDWSDVLGVASMVGWDPNVIDKTATRCASLFREGITFRTLDEGESTFQECSYSPDKDTSHYIANEVKSRVNETAKREVDLFGGVHVDGFLKPIDGKKSWKYSSTGSVTRSKSRRATGKSSEQLSPSN